VLLNATRAILPRHGAGGAQWSWSVGVAPGPTKPEPKTIL
jgi:hypothetical protein